MRKAASLLSIVFITTLLLAQYENPGSYGSLETNGTRLTVTGVIHDQSGNPVSGAKIDVNDLTSGRMVATTYSSASGAFEVHGLSNKQYEMVATSGISEIHTRLEGGFTHDIALTLPINQEPGSPGSGSAVSVSQMKVPGKARKLFQKAMEAFHKSHVEDAFGFVQQALGLYPDYAKALTLRGVLNLQKGDAKDAQPDLERAVELDYTDDMSFVALASLYNSQHKFEEALRILERGLTIHPASWQALLESARAQCGKLQFNEALRSLGKADSVIPAEVNYQHLYRAQAFIGLKNYPPAIEELETYLKKQATGHNADLAKQMLGQLKEMTQAKN